MHVGSLCHPVFLKQAEEPPQPPAPHPPTAQLSRNTVRRDQRMNHPNLSPFTAERALMPNGFLVSLSRSRHIPSRGSCRITRRLLLAARGVIELYRTDFCLKSGTNCIMHTLPSDRLYPASLGCISAER